MWSVFFESVRVTWQQRRRKREGGRGRERKPQHTQRPLLIKHLRGQFAFPGAQKLPGQKERGWREGRAEQSRAGLACRCSQRLGLFPPEMEAGGNCKHIHAHTHTHTDTLPPSQRPDYINLLTSSSHLGSPSAPTRSHTSRPGHPAFLRPV